MHQGMLALINSMVPFFMKKDFRKYVVPWTIFTEPQVSSVGMSEFELDQRKIRYETITMKYEDYGAAIAEEIGIGHVKVFVSTFGKIYGAQIIGEGSGEMINEFALAIQNNIRMHSIMFTQHSFPTMSFLIKRASEQWMMNRMKSDMLKRLAKFFYRLFN
jgi:pyruvate/2-oxoglutarate dehydrogenase complex dihydrolipoamide dehydrogenase (E3) component